MASKPRPPFRLWSRLHFLIRFLGLTGLLAAGFGVAFAFLENVLDRWKLLSGLNEENLLSDYDYARATILGESGTLGVRVAVTLLVAGLAVALVALLLELLIGLFFVAGRRSAFGVNAFVQMALAAALLVGVNLFSYRHYVRYDWTGGRQFTLPAEIRSQLAQLAGETTIVVYQRHKTFGNLSEKPDAYDYAAERKVVEKVKDLVEQFREFGPQFRVVVLDVEEEGFGDKLDQLTRDNPALRTAIDQAPENSIFFSADGKVQALSFNDFYLLDKTASQEDNSGRGNLVLLYQGVRPFADRVLNVEERRPRIAVAVIHEVLGLEGSEELGMAGAKRALAAHGFDSRDVILKRWTEFGPPEPAVLTYDENKLDRLEEEIKELREGVQSRDKELEALREHIKQWQTAPVAELSKTELAKDLGIDQVTESIRGQVLARVLEPNVGLRQFLNERERKELEDLNKEWQGLQKAEESLAEQRRNPDLKAKTQRVLADCDLLLLPRMTLFNVARGERIPNRVYSLDPAQVEAFREFLKAGKPVLVCFGPTNEPTDRPDPLAAGGPDPVEELLEKLGIKLAKQTVLFNIETKSFAERRSGLLIPGAAVEVPPVQFDWKPGAGRPGAAALAAEPPPPNLLRESLRLTARGLGKNQSLDLRLRHPRPVYYDPGPGKQPAVEAEFMLTDAESWNESQPFPSRDRTPRYEPPKSDGPDKDPLEKERLGPFPIGVAVETKVPAEWYPDKKTDPPTVRVVAIGHGGVFMGSRLSPAREELLVNTCNWLLGRDSALPTDPRTASEEADKRVWSYPRVKLGERERVLWNWGAWLLFPTLFAYLGLVVLLARRLR